MFVWRWNRMDEKFWRENGKENFFEVCLIGWRRRKINDGAQVFSLQANQKVFSPKWRENWREKMKLFNGWKCPCAFAHGLCLYVALLCAFILTFPLLFFFSFDLLGRLHLVYVAHILFFFFFFYFFLFGCLSLFFFNCA